MPDRRPSTEELADTLRALARDLEIPRTPSLSPAVASRLLAERAARVRRPLARRALWTPRRTLLLATIGLLGLLALAAGARFVLGAAEIRVQPGTSPSGPPIGPGALGEPATLDAVSAAVGFRVRLPLGAAPDAAFVYASEAGHDGALLAWDAGARFPALPGTPWGLIVMEMEGQDEFVVKNVNAFEDTDEIRLDGRRAFWIHAPHELVVVTDAGDERFAVEGNVLIWEESGITFRMETALGRPDALALARTMG